MCLESMKRMQEHQDWQMLIRCNCPTRLRGKYGEKYWESYEI